ncbi:MAG: nucleotidyltransferase domain-containing protein [Candidatus Methanoplasma sp.]|nr:nucleotidyltransferase domain-containing protein [Candidatus Methanoplasma sp.]
MSSADTGCNVTLDELKEIIAPIAEKYGMICVYLFGSRARGDCNEKSDFDFCVVAPEGCTLFDLGGFLYDLRDALGSEVDVVCEEGVKRRPHLMEEMLRDRKVVFEA